MLLDVKGKMGNAGLEWNMKKCKVMHMKRGKLVMLDGDIRLYDNTIIECLKDSESYKFLGVPESDTHKVSDIISHLKLKVQQRCNIIWSSPLSDYYKVMATNMFAISAVQYYMWSERIRITDLREMDTIIRKILNSYSVKYSLQLNSILYIPRSIGGRGLKNLESIYKQVKVKTAVNLIETTDPCMKVVAEVDRVRKSKGRSSIINDGISYALNDFNASLIDMGESFTFTNCNKSMSEKKVVFSEIKKSAMETFRNQVQSATWQGVIFVNRMNDVSLVQVDCYKWLTKWKECAVNVINDIHSLYLQTIPTLTFKKFRSVEMINSVTCRICHNGNETVKHLLSNCSELAKNILNVTIKRYNVYYSRF